MCGRYSLTRREEEIVERFGVERLFDAPGTLLPRYNIAPSQMVPAVISQDGKRVLCQLQWGLIPFWAKDLKAQKPVINARSETAAEKPYFKQALSKRRCLIPADGFYEWKRQNNEKLPMYIHASGDKKLFAFAGLWDEWRSPDGEVKRTCTILTTDANNTMSPVHDRMPVILSPELESVWLNPEITDPKELMAVLQPMPDEALEMYQVSSMVNSPKQDSPQLLDPAAVQGRLF